MNIQKIFKPYIVKRPNGGCQVLFPLTELDTIVEEILKEVEKDSYRMVKVNVTRLGYEKPKYKRYKINS